jgi:hypothetical protein
MATIHLMEQVVRDNRKGYVIFLSGQDYPIRSNAEINAFISRNQDYNFLDLKPIDQVWPSFRLRTDYYKFNVSSRRGDFVMYRPFHPASLVKAVYGYTRGKIDLSAFRLLMKKRQLRVIRNLFGGSQWFALNHETLLRLCAFIEEHREELFSHFQYTFCADEIFVHSILGHLSAQISDIRFGPSLTYVNWNGRNGEYPVTFELSDREEILSQPEGKLFARKFDAMRCPHILDALDEHRT